MFNKIPLEILSQITTVYNYIQFEMVRIKIKSIDNNLNHCRVRSDSTITSIVLPNFNSLSFNSLGICITSEFFHNNKSFLIPPNQKATSPILLKAISKYLESCII